MKTTTLYSCCGVAMVNVTTRRGGLYHYPSGTAGTIPMMETLRAVINDVVPSYILITAAARAPTLVPMIGDMGSDPHDVEELRERVRSLAPRATIMVGRRGHGAVLYWEGTKPIFNKEPDIGGTGKEPRASPVEFKGSAIRVGMGHLQEGDARAYGFS